MVVWVSFLKSNEKKSQIAKKHLICALFKRPVLSSPGEGVHRMGWGGLPHLLMCWASPFLFSDYSCAAQYGSHSPHAAINQLV